MADVTIKVGVDMSAIDAAQARVNAVNAQAGRIGTTTTGGVAGVSAEGAVAGGIVGAAMAGGMVSSGSRTKGWGDVDIFAPFDDTPGGADYIGVWNGRPTAGYLGGPIGSAPGAWYGNWRTRWKGFGMDPESMDSRNYTGTGGLQEAQARFAAEKNAESLKKLKHRMNYTRTPMLTRRMVFTDQEWVGAPGLEEVGGGRWRFIREGRGIAGSVVQPGLPVNDSQVFFQPDIRLRGMFEGTQPYTKAGLVTPGRSISVPAKTYLSENATWKGIATTQIASNKLIRGLAYAHLAKEFARNYEQNGLMNPDRKNVWGSDAADALAQTGLGVVSQIGSIVGAVGFGLESIIDSVTGGGLGGSRRIATDHKNWNDWINTLDRKIHAAAEARAALNEFEEKSDKWNKEMSLRDKFIEFEIDQKTRAFAGRVADSGIGGFGRGDIERSVKDLYAYAVREEHARENERTRPKWRSRGGPQSGEFN